MGHRYTPEQLAFLREQLPGKTHRETTELFNAHFDLCLTVGQIKAAGNNHSIRTGRRAPSKAQTHRYTEEEIAFIREQLPGKTYREMTDLFNERFGLNLSVVQMSGAIGNRKIRSGLKPYTTYDRHHYTEEQIAFIREQLPGKTHQEMTYLFNRRFGLNLTLTQVTAAAKNRHINNGLDGRIKKGNIPPNKGRKGYCAPGSEKGWFRKGNRPQTYVPVGTESITTDGYPVVKVADPNKWRLKHRMIWEAAYGPIPPKYCIMFADGDTGNCVLDNLLLVSYRERAVLNRLKLYGGSKELTETGLAIVKVIMAATARKKKLTERTRQEG